MTQAPWQKIVAAISRNFTPIISLIMVSGAAVYYIYSLNWIGILLTAGITALAFFILRPFGKSEIDYRWNKFANRWLAVYIVSFLTLLVILFIARTDRALISPWPVVNPLFFFFYALASLALVFLTINQGLGKSWKTILLGAHYFISFAVALIVYKIGYGFDPFIHQATMELIAQKGAVFPKPPYYLGQYSLIVIFHKLTLIPIRWLDLILVPALGAILLPPAILRFLRSKKSASLTALFLLILTYPFLTLTTPQNLSYLFLILTVLNGLSETDLKLTIILALATSAIHPLTGLPALIWVGWLVIGKMRPNLKLLSFKIARVALWLASAFALPFALILSGGHWQKNLSASLFNLYFDPSGREDWLMNIVYLVGNNLGLLISALVAISVIIGYKEIQKSGAMKYLIVTAAGLVIAYILTLQINFEALIGYEQTAYAERIPIVILIFLLPFIILAIDRTAAKIMISEQPIKYAWLFSGLGLITASLYLSYPRFDRYWNSRGYSTSVSDIKAVELVDRQASEPYVVLANQQVSAAALSRFGFDHYFQTAAGQLYFYPIPTGSPLYRYYLETVYKNPVRENLNGVRELTGVKKTYLIINKYWYDSGRVINEAKLAADKWWSVDGTDFVFEYSLKP